MLVFTPRRHSYIQGHNPAMTPPENALQYPDFRIYIAGKIFGLHALWMQRMSLGWIAWELTESASFVGIVAFANFVPTLVTGPFFGVWIDRVRVQRAALATQSLMLLLTLLLVLLIQTGILGSAILLIVALLLGIVASAHHPVRMSLAPRLVERAAISSVISTVAILFNIARMSGPALGGWLISQWGISACLAVQVVLYAPFILALSLLHPRENAPSESAPEPILRALYTGLRHVGDAVIIRNALLVTGVVAFVVRGVMEVFPVLADGVFDKGSSGLGLLLSSAGFGALLAGIVKAILPNEVAERFPCKSLVSALVGLTAVPLVGFSPVWGITLGLVALLGFCVTLSAISLQTTVQMGLSDDLRGRVMSIWTMTAIGMSAAGAAFMGVMFDLFGFAPTLAVAGLAGLAAVALVARRV